MSSKVQFSDTEIGTTTNALPMISGTPAERFVQHCIEYYHEWAKVHADRIQKREIDSNQSLLMIYAEAPSATLGIKNEESLLTPKERKYKTTYSLENGAAVVTENLHYIYCIVPQFSNPDEALAFAANHLDSSNTFVLLLLGQQRAFIHRAEDDLELESWCDEPETLKLNTFDASITPDTIAQALVEFHDECTRTPRGFTARHMWVPKTPEFLPEPELKIQSDLLIYFKGYFRNARAFVDEEASNPGGRTDICIQRMEEGPKLIKKTTMLELKVLKPNQSQNWNFDWAKKGITQAKGYRKHNTDATFACIYDARKDQSNKMHELKQIATDEDVRLEMYSMELPQHQTPSKIDKKPKASVKTTKKKAAKKKPR